MDRRTFDPAELARGNESKKGWRRLNPYPQGFAMRRGADGGAVSGMDGLAVVGYGRGESGR